MRSLLRAVLNKDLILTLDFSGAVVQSKLAKQAPFLVSLFIHPFQVTVLWRGDENEWNALWFFFGSGYATFLSNQLPATVSFHWSDFDFSVSSNPNHSMILRLISSRVFHSGVNQNRQHFNAVFSMSCSVTRGQHHPSMDSQHDNGGRRKLQFPWKFSEKLHSLSP